MGMGMATCRAWRKEAAVVKLRAETREQAAFLQARENRLAALQHERREKEALLLKRCTELAQEARPRHSMLVTSLRARSSVPVRRTAACLDVKKR